MKTSPLSLAALLQRYFEDYLIGQCRFSIHTVKAYKDAWRLFLIFLQAKSRVKPSSMVVSALRSSDILNFLEHVEKTRCNSVQTRNARLTALRGAIRYALSLDPTLPAPVHQILAIPIKRMERRTLGFLEQEEMNAILAAPDTEQWSGRRDRMLFETMYNTGSRVSEIILVRVSDVHTESPSQILLHGKGRKERIVPLWKSTTLHLRQWIRENRMTPEDTLFPSSRGTPLSRSAVAKRLAKVIEKAKGKCPSITRQSVSPHTLRHTTAMHLLDSGVDLTVISLWLGHESIETTNRYISSSLTMKEKALSCMREPSIPLRRYRASDSLLAYLEGI